MAELKPAVSLGVSGCRLWRTAVREAATEGLGWILGSNSGCVRRANWQTSSQFWKPKWLISRCWSRAAWANLSQTPSGEIDNPGSNGMNTASDIYGHLGGGDEKSDTKSGPPGGVTDTTPGYTDRVQRVLAAARGQSGPKDLSA